MREYGQIQCAYWRDPEIRGLGSPTREFGAYLLTGPHSNGLGCYFLPLGYVVADLGWTEQRIVEGFGKLSEIGFVRVCSTTSFVFLPKFLYWNEITNPNVARARAGEFESVPKKASFYQELCECLRRFGKHWPKEFEKDLETLSKQEPTRTEPNLPEPRESGAACAAPADAEKSAGKKGTRFKPEQACPAAWRAACAEMRPDLDADAVYGAFSDYWISKPGQYGLKLDWLATWRNWLRKEKPGTAGAPRVNGGSSSSAPDQWWKSDAGVRIKGEELKIPVPPPGAPPAEWLMYRARVLVEAGDGPWLPDEREITLYRAVQWVRSGQSTSPRPS